MMKEKIMKYAVNNTQHCVIKKFIKYEDETF